MTKDLGVPPSGSGSHASHEAVPSSPPVSIPDGVKSHPDYADGYYAAFHGRAFDTKRADSEEYAYGFEAGTRAVALFESHGMRRKGAGFSIKLSTRPGRPS